MGSMDTWPISKGIWSNCMELNMREALWLMPGQERGSVSSAWMRETCVWMSEYERGFVAHALTGEFLCW